MGPIHRIVVLVALGAALLVSAIPGADAAPVAFDDAAGDGTPFEAPVPGSEPNLDIVQGSMAVDGENLLFTMKVADITVVLPNGSVHDFSFQTDGVTYSYNLYRDVGFPFSQNDIFWTTSPDDDGDDLTFPACGCKAKVSESENTLTIVQPLTALNRQHRKLGKSPLGPGSLLGSLEQNTSRYVWGSVIPSDSASGGDLAFVM